MLSSMDDARAALRRQNPDLVVLTGAVHEPHSVHLAAMARDHEISTLALLEPTDSERTERVVRLGVTETMMKPARADEILETARRLLERRGLQERTGIIGESAAIQEVLVEIEQFGHEKGAFTGAAERRLGRFELADTGTIFLDEIGEIAPSTQVKLLRVLESRTFFRVGGTVPIKVDVRVVAATNKALREAVALGEFRDDLYYRLNVLNINLAPLRERREDIPILVRRFIREFARAQDRTFRGITPEALQRLVSAPWPGNVRQLRNLIESMVVLAPGAEIRASDIPPDVLEGPGTLLPVRVPQAVQGQGGGFGGQELEFILRNLVELKIQVEDLRRRIDDHPPQRVQVIDLGDHGTVDVLPENDKDGESLVVYRTGMTMA